MKISFLDVKNIQEVKSNVLVMFLSEEYIKNFLKDNGKCSCGTDCQCGEKCECPKCPIQTAMYEFNFAGKKLQTAIVSSQHSNFDRIVCIGIGKESELCKVKAEKIGYKTSLFLNANKIKNITCIFNTKVDKNGSFIYSDKIAKESSDFLYSHLIFGLSMGEYNFNKYLTGDKLEGSKLSLEEVIVSLKDFSEFEMNFAEFEMIQENVFLCRDLVNEPSNIIYPESFAKIAKSLEKLGVEVEILKIKDMEKLGMGSLLAVGQGSDNEASMVILKWNGLKNDDSPVAFVGKGVTFDSGGLSLKPSNAMEDMKCDMAGSATVYCLIRLLAMRKAKVNAIGVMPLVENMPSGKAVKVGDVVESMSKQTIEVLNTDAEGRMILADALYYTVTKFNPKIVIDLATLTGAICVALGSQYSGLFSNNNDLVKELEVAGIETGENVWRMPLSKIGGFYDKEIDSDIADVRNTGKTRDGGSITAAQFLQRFINKHEKWAHLDIASTAFVNSESFMTKKHGTGYGVRLLNTLIKNNYEK